MAIETLNTPKGWTRMSCQDEDAQDAAVVSDITKISGTEMYYQTMRQSEQYTPPNYNTTRWYLIAFMMHSNGSMEDLHCYYKDSATQPSFPAVFPATTTIPSTGTSSGGKTSSGGSTSLVVEEPVVAVSAFPFTYVLVGAAGGALIGLAGKKTVLKKKKAVKPATAAAVGAVAGAIGGYLYGR